MTDDEILDLWSPPLSTEIRRPILGRNKILVFARAVESKTAEQERARSERLERTITAVTTWLEANQPDVFRRGIWDAIGEAPK